ncbi:MAG: hypothetical protein ACOVSW_17435 [Candidatus Kapaibacteriota bacterium]|jgi:hypothetical protein
MMRATEALQNKPPQHIFGFDIIRHAWHFVALKDRKYAISTPFLCSTDGIFDIYRILKGLRVAIENILDSQQQ